MKKIFVPDTLQPGGHYTPAIVSNGLVFTSGLLPINQLTGEKLNSSSFKDQALMVFENLNSILQAAGTSIDNIVKVSVYLKNINDWAEFNSLYSTMIGDHKPARTVVPVPELHFGFLLEMEAVAEL